MDDVGDGCKKTEFEPLSRLNCKLSHQLSEEQSEQKQLINQMGNPRAKETDYLAVETTS